MSRLAAWPAFAALAFPALLARAPCAAQEHAGLREGALQNDCFLPLSAEADAALAAGDLALAQGRSTEAFEAWRRALVATVTGDSSSPRAGLGEPDAARRTEGVEDAVLARLSALPEHDGLPGARAFAARFEALAAGELADAGRSTVLLAEVERRNPATRSAALAALSLADTLLENGRALAAATMLERAALHLALLGGPVLPVSAAGASDVAELAAALERRLQAVHALRQRDLTTAGAWERASSLSLLGTAPHLPGRQSTSEAQPKLGRGARAGPCFLADGRVAVQSAEHVGLLDPEVPQLLGRFAPAELLASTPLERPPPASGAWREAPGWPFLPATDGRDLVLVQGRWAGSQGGNALLCVRPPVLRAKGTRAPEGPDLPELRWALRETRWRRTDGAVVEHPLLAELAGCEWQPGPLVQDRWVVAAARIEQGDVRAYLVVLELDTGEPRWVRLVAVGADFSPYAGRFDVRSRSVAAAQPPALADGRAFLGTSLGAGALFDVLDGRLHWSLRNRRRDAAASGWAGERPLVWWSGAGPVLTWTPPDSDHLYALRAIPDLDGAGPFAAAPLSIGEAEALVHAGPGELAFLARAGPVRTVRTRSTTSGEQFDGVHLLPEEEFSGAGLASELRLLACTSSGLYLFDRTRELYLLQHVPLATSGSVHARGDLVLVVGSESVAVLRALP